MTSERNRRRARRGFTLIELMVVIAIIGIIGTVVTAKILDNIEKAKTTTAELQMNNLMTALKLFYLDNGFYPSTEQGLQSLVEKPASGNIPEKWREGGYLEKREVPRDPWGTEYLFLAPGRDGEQFQIISYGRDKQEGGDGVDADIVVYQQ